MPANVLRSEPAPAAAAAVCRAAAGLRDWPLPDGPWQRGGGEPAPACQVQLDARRFVNGRLLGIDTRRGVLRWGSADGRDVGTLRFAGLRCLRLMALVAAEPPDSPAWRPAPVLLPFRVEFTDGQVWTGSTFRSPRIDDAQGLFVFEPVDEIGNLRLAFVPRSAWRSLRVGTARADQAGQAGAAVRTDQAVTAVPVLAGARTLREADALKSVVGRAASRRLGQVLIDLGLIDEKRLQRALSLQRAHRDLPLGELLVREGLVTREGLALAVATKEGRALGAP